MSMEALVRKGHSQEFGSSSRGIVGNSGTQKVREMEKSNRKEEQP